MNDLEKKRHSLAHLLAAAVLEHDPEAKLTIGPAIDSGFYYDFELSIPSTELDLKAVEKSMKKLLNKWDGFEHKEVSAKEAKEIYKDNPYKMELINEIEEKGEKITLYTSGDFTDLCKGGHMDSMKGLDAKSFKLDKVAGAYWRGDEKNPMLTRIYGLAFETKEDLDEYLKIREEAVKRDHRKIGKELGLFTFSDLVGPGLPLFTPKGTALRNAIISKIHEIQGRYGYQEVWIPHITKSDLYKTSGHWEKFGDELFHVKGKESEFVLKPMNCPHHTQIYASAARSYKDLPLRFTEATAVYRDEQSGELLGLSRVRSITQDDGHVFCTEDQIEEEIGIMVKVIKEFYSLLGMFEDGKYRVTLSVRDPENLENYLGEDSIWNTAEDALAKSAEKEGLSFEREEGEAAFYGPKLDFKFKDAIGREWQLATAQLDFNMPKRFGLEYTDKDGTKKTPAMIHRAIAGSLERFLSVIIEHFAGEFPFWMSPIQAKIVPVADVHNEKAKEVFDTIKEKGFRVELDDGDDGFGKKVRKAKNDKVPYFIILGDKDIEDNKVTLESRNGESEQISLDEVIEKFEGEK
ncbi:MAG: threonyl-tRNA synthetase [Candidatus Paceibacteria bacterium]|jgi:threonyl-tRNA synthetase